MVQPAGGYLNCWPNDGDCTRVVEFHRSWGPGSVALLVQDGKGRGTGWALGLRVCKLGQFSWDFSHSSVLLSSMDFMPMESAGAVEKDRPW